MTETQESFVVALFQKGIVRLGAHKLSSGLQSPIFFDIGDQLGAHPSLLRDAAHMLWSVTSTLVPCDYVANVPEGSTPLATALSLQQNIPLLRLRRDGAGMKVATQCDQKGRVVIIEDALSTGRSVERAMEAVVHAGYIVAGVCCLVDRQQGGKERLGQQGVTVLSCFTLLEAIALYADWQLISREQREVITAFVADPYEYRDNHLLRPQS